MFIQCLALAYSYLAFIKCLKVRKKTCHSHLIEIVPTFHSMGTVPQHHPQARRIMYSSQQLRALYHVNQVGRQMAEGKPKIIPYNVIATIRKLRINRKPIRSKHNRYKLHKQKGINRHTMHNIFISRRHHHQTKHPVQSGYNQCTFYQK